MGMIDTFKRIVGTDKSKPERTSKIEPFNAGPVAGNTNLMIRAIHKFVEANFFGEGNPMEDGIIVWNSETGDVVPDNLPAFRPDLWQERIANAVDRVGGDNVVVCVQAVLAEGYVDDPDPVKPEDDPNNWDAVTTLHMDVDGNKNVHVCEVNVDEENGNVVVYGDWMKVDFSNLAIWDEGFKELVENALEA